MRRAALVFVLLLSACAPDLREEFPFDGELPAGSYVSHEDLGGGVTRTQVIATAQGAWVYLDLDTKAEIPAGEAVGAPQWDLAFQRYRIISNGGVSGVGSVEVAILPGADFAALTRAPASGYLRDAPDGSDANTDLDSAFLIDDGWYEYSFSEHRLAPRDLVFVVKNEAAYFKVKFVGYYSEAGSSAHPTFEWAALLPP